MRFWLLSLFIIYGCAISAAGEESEPAAPAGGAGDVTSHPTGLIPLTPAELAWERQHAPVVKRVRLNHLGLERVNAERVRRGMSPLAPGRAGLAPRGRETEGLPAAADLKAAKDKPAPPGEPTPGAPTTLPATIDNSTLKWFPPIGDQGDFGSCAQFACGYYAMTHMWAMANDLDAKSSEANRFSPKWTYNMLNGGSYLNGTTLPSAFRIGMEGGLATWAEFPYSGSITPATNYREWCMDSAIWRASLDRRFEQYGIVTGTDAADDAGRLLVKQMLLDGYVLTVGTYAYGWQFRELGDDPATTADDALAGQNCIFWVKGTSGGHAVTVVGYNDDVWTDVNGNGSVDAGEKGAFLLANSWGTDWEDGNAGFIWMAYDALRDATGVSGGPKIRREPAWWGGQAYYVNARADYRPAMVAEFTVSHAARNQMIMRLGLDEVGATVPTIKWWPAHTFQNAGGSYAFDGTTTACDGTFWMDFEQILPEPGAEKRWFVSFGDVLGSPVGALKAMKLYRAGAGGDQLLGAASDLPKSSDGYYVSGWVDCAYAAAVAPSISAQPADATVNAGGAATFSVIAAGTDPLSYQWRRDGVDISGATGSSYTTPATLVTDSGARFSVVVSNDAGSATSDAAALTVRRFSPPVVSISAPEGAAWFAPGAEVSFAGSASDAEDGDLTSGLVWRATGPDGTVQVGTGASGSCFLTAGAYAITATATDSCAQETRATVGIVVGVVPPAVLAPVDWNLSSQRWRDMAANPYTAEKVSGYTYPESGVALEWFGAGATLTGTLSGAALKPNFAYQIKLNGKPTRNWGADGDDAANERLGYAGRWWVNKVDRATGATVAGWNSSDGEYEYWKARDFADTQYDYVFEGYLLFDFAGTGADGVFSEPLSLDSSLHVLWRTSQRTPTSADGAVRDFTVTAQAGDWYGGNYPTTTVSLYGEGQTGRPAPGTLTLPTGCYNVRMFVTEESFHESALTNPAGGSWATVMAYDHLVFTVDPTRTAPSITAQPESQTVSEGETATFAVTATGSEPLSYQWLRGGVEIPGATGSSYTTPPTVRTDTCATFSVVVRNLAGVAASESATLTVIPVNRPPVIDSAMPGTPLVMTVGSTETFAVWASDGDGDELSYSWKIDGAALPLTEMSIDYSPTLAELGSHTIQVTVGDGSGETASWTWSVKVVLQAPVVIGPVGSVPGPRPVFSWEVVDGADYYSVKCFNAGGATVFTKPITAPSVQSPVDLVNGNLYRWTVCAVGSNGVGMFSAEVEFTPVSLPAPVVIGPVGTVAGPRPVFSWEDVDGAECYSVKCFDAGGATVFTKPITATSVQSPVDLVNGNLYRWTVCAVGSNGAGTYSSETEFTPVSLPAPVVIGPVGSVPGPRPVFSWEAVDGADYYSVKCRDVDGVEVFSKPVTGTSVQSPVNLAEGQVYRWQVCAVGAQGAGNFSAEVEFTPIGLPAPVAIGPVGNVTGPRPIFSWEGVDGADYYSVKCFDAGGAVVFTKPISATSVQSPVDLVSGNVYRWKVCAVGATGAGSYSGEVEFIPTALPAPGLMAPGGTSDSVKPTFSWQVVEGASYYSVRCYDAADAEIFYRVTTSTSIVSPVVLQAGQTYHWKVCAVGAAGPGNWSELVAFVVAP